MARGVTNDIGEPAAKKSRGLAELAKCSLHHSERDVHTLVSKKLSMSIDLELHTIEKRPGMRYTGELKALSLKDWFGYMLRYNIHHILVGLEAPDAERESSILKAFWSHYRQLEPTHQMWEKVDAGELPLERTYPLLLHGDEGRGRKRQAFLVIAWSSLMGSGTSLANATRQNRPYIRMRLNYTGSTWSHRLLTCVLPKMFKDEIGFECVMNFVKDDAASMFNEGVCHNGLQYHSVCIAVTGDWAWLVKSANLGRSFHNCEKRPKSASSVPKGICHWCAAGKDGYPWEDMSLTPAWLQTLFGDNPFLRRPQLLELPHCPEKPQAFYAWDIWHGFHLGLGKVWAATCLCIMSDAMTASSVDERFEQITALYITWLDDHKTSGFLNSITKEGCGWPDRGTFPNGQWSKGHITLTLIRFFLSWTETLRLVEGSLLKSCEGGCKLINEAFHILYSNDLWLAPNVAMQAASCGLRFLQMFQDLAKRCYDEGQAFFCYMPKSHLVAHVWHQLRHDASRGVWSLNPLCMAVQCSEDYIGKVSRLSRRVSPTQVVVRTLERSLNATFKHWVDRGWIKPQ